MSPCGGTTTSPTSHGDGAQVNPPDLLTEIPHPRGSAETGGAPSKLAVSDHAPARRSPSAHDHTGGDIDAHALHCQGWTISAIARHLGRDRKTIRAYLRGDRQSGLRARPAADPFGPFATYCAARLAEDPHLWATTLFDEVTRLGDSCCLELVHFP